MSFSNTQLTKNMSSQLFYDITNPRKYVIFKYAINEKHVITFLHNLLIYDIICNNNTRRI